MTVFSIKISEDLTVTFWLDRAGPQADSYMESVTLKRMDQKTEVQFIMDRQEVDRFYQSLRNIKNGNPISLDYDQTGTTTQA